MPAIPKLASAVTLSLALVGAGTAIAQSSAAVDGHSSYVQLVSVHQGSGPQQVLEGTFTCDPALHEELVRRYLNEPLCESEAYAYAYPDDEPAPWKATVTGVDDGQTISENGSVWHVAEVTYQTVGTASEGGPELVHAMASQLVAEENPTDTKERSYRLPVDGELANETEKLEVQPGPAPDEISLPS